MSINLLNWRQLLPNLDAVEPLLMQADTLTPIDPLSLQPRLSKALQVFSQQTQGSRFMLVNAGESSDYFPIVKMGIEPYLPILHNQKVYNYQIIDNNQVIVVPTYEDVVSPRCIAEDWIEADNLLGCVRYTQNQSAIPNQYSLHPGLIQQINNGVLILPIKTFLMQPVMWLRFKQMVINQKYQWFSFDEKTPLPFDIQETPLNLKVVLIGDDTSLYEFQALEPELFYQSIYAEFEMSTEYAKNADLQNWCAHINYYCETANLPKLAAESWSILINEATRYCEDQFRLPLSPLWIKQQLINAYQFYNGESHITSAMFTQAIAEKYWLESRLAERALQDVHNGQINIDTEGEVLGQINGLSVLEYPGHPRAFGEVSRISCVAYAGDNEITDIERKAELGGNIHAKGIMIMQAYISSELAYEHPLPFSASIVFEQSYGEIDGDSASLAEFCAYISALSQQPIDQQFAVTGSVDQFGNIQAIGGINEKIEAFFDICNSRCLTGSQGVILPYANLRHLCLKNDVINAVKEGKFHLWYAKHISDVLPILTDFPYHDEENISLLGLIQERIESINQEQKSRNSIFSWLKSFKQH